jgi:6-phosphogluconate dehydrogenase
MARLTNQQLLSVFVFVGRPPETSMQLGMIGLGRMGANIVRRLNTNAHECVVFDVNTAAVASLTGEHIVGAASLADLASKMTAPRAIWIMVPAAVTDATIDALVPHLAPGDIIIDGGNSYYHDDLRRSAALQSRGIHYVDCGTSGGVFGLERGYCLMIGGETPIVQHLDPIFRTLAPGVASAPRTPGNSGEPGTAEHGYLHCGPSGAGHFVKMIHNGIEYGIMAAYAEGLNILHHANIGKHDRDADAETTPLRHPEHYQYDFDLSQVTEVWRRGSVIGSWLLDLSAAALREDATLAGFAGRVSDSGEGRWALAAAIDEAVPAPVLSAALYDRFSSRGGADFANRMLSALRKQFGGHAEKPVGGH